MGQFNEIRLPATLDCNPINRIGGRLRICEVAIYRGPHIYSRTKMIRLQIDLGVLEYWPTDWLPGFTGRLLELLPGLHRHQCSTGYEGGLVERMQDGTWLGHVIEHVALELQLMVGAVRITRGKTRSVKGRPGVYNVMYAYQNEDVGLLAGRLALELVASLVAPLVTLEGAEKVHGAQLPVPFDFPASLAVLRETARKTRLGPTTGALVAEAERRGIPWQRLDDYSLIQFGTGRRQKRIR
ncbi:MAG: cyanophycin synthetase, partial [Sphingomonadales bacterium]